MDWTRCLAEFSLRRPALGRRAGADRARLRARSTRARGVINFAIGEFMMLGAYLFYTAHVLLEPAVVAGARADARRRSRCSAALVERVVLRPLAGPAGRSRIAHGHDRPRRACCTAWSRSSGAATTCRCRSSCRARRSCSASILIPGQVLWSFALAAVADRRASPLYFRYSQDRRRDARHGERPGHRLRDGDRRAQDAAPAPGCFAGVVGAVAGVVVGVDDEPLADARRRSALGVLAVIILGGLDSVAGAIVAGLIVGWLESITVALPGRQGARPGALPRGRS